MLSLPTSCMGGCFVLCSKHGPLLWRAWADNKTSSVELGCTRGTSAVCHCSDIHGSVHSNCSSVHLELGCIETTGGHCPSCNSLHPDGTCAPHSGTQSKVHVRYSSLQKDCSDYPQDRVLQVWVLGHEEVCSAYSNGGLHNIHGCKAQPGLHVAGAAVDFDKL